MKTPRCLQSPQLGDYWQWQSERQRQACCRYWLGVFLKTACIAQLKALCWLGLYLYNSVSLDPSRPLDEINLPHALSSGVSCCNRFGGIVSACHLSRLFATSLALWRPLLPYGYSCIASYASRPSFVIFDIRALWRWALSVRVPGCQKIQMTAQPGLA